MARDACRKNISSHLFSIQLASQDCVKCLSIPHEKESKVLMEGFLGDLESLRVIEGVMLEITGSNGTIRMDLSEEEISNLMRAQTE
jgi:hypothetical protein